MRTAQELMSLTNQYLHMALDVQFQSWFQAAVNPHFFAPCWQVVIMGTSSRGAQTQHHFFESQFVATFVLNFSCSGLR